MKKINPNNNIFNIFPRFFWKLMNKRIQTFYYLDTNMFILKKKDYVQEERFIKKKLSRFRNKRIIISNIVQNEINKYTYRNDYVQFFKTNYQTTSFEQIRSLNPNVCPAYFNFLQSMLNPANIASPAFFKERYLSFKYHNSNPNKEDEDFLHRIISQKFNRSKNNTKNVFGENKNDFERIVDDIGIKYYQKKSDAFKKNNIKNYLNDIKVLSEGILFCLIHKVNIVFCTADGDMIIHLLNWIDSMAHHITLKKIIITNLGEDGINRIWSGKECVTYKIFFKEYYDLENEIRADILNRDWKKDGHIFDLLYWDQKSNKFIKIIKLNFNEITTRLLLDTHGSFSCPYAQNNLCGNFFNYRFVWPPKKEENDPKIEIEVFPKRYRNTIIKIKKEKKHTRDCLYANNNKNCNFSFLSSFWPSE